MKTGLLQCDHVAAELRHLGGDYEDVFRALFPELDLQIYNVVDGQFPDDVSDCDAYLCTGSKYSVYEDLSWIDELKDFVRQVAASQQRFVGVCFGHQLLADALGGQVSKAEVGWCIGVHSFTVTQREAWMQPYRPTINLLMSCQDQVVQAPPGATILAQAPDCAVGMFRIGDRLLGMQAHPEFSPAYARALIERRRERIGAEKTDRGLDSLHMTLQTQVVREWVLRFLEAEREPGT